MLTKNNRPTQTKGKKKSSFSFFPLWELDGKTYHLGPDGNFWPHPLSDEDFKRWFECLHLHQTLDQRIGSDL